MSKRVSPSAFHLATTRIVDDGLLEYLEHIGAPDWTSDALDDHSLLTEVAGRSCYKSFAPGLNKNVRTVRPDNMSYVRDGILGQKHGSVLEHSTDTFALTDVSRIVTHELVRHRQGTAFSQESGRFVRIDEISYYYPDALSDEFLRTVYDSLPTEHRPENLTYWTEQVGDIFDDFMDAISEKVTKLESVLKLDHVASFDLKKKLQSSIRRLAPSGMATNIIVTANHRAWRHIISARTSGAAEEEFRLIQYEVYKKLHDLHPAIYQDAVVTPDENSLPSTVPVVSFQNEKV